MNTDIKIMELHCKISQKPKYLLEPHQGQKLPTLLCVYMEVMTSQEAPELSRFYTLGRVSKFCRFYEIQIIPSCT